PVIRPRGEGDAEARDRGRDLQSPFEEADVEECAPIGEDPLGLAGLVGEPAFAAPSLDDRLGRDELRATPLDGAPARVGLDGLEQRAEPVVIPRLREHLLPDVERRLLKIDDVRGYFRAREERADVLLAVDVGDEQIAQLAALRTTVIEGHVLEEM